MDLTPHLLTGAALAVRVKRPSLAMLAAIASHFVLDSIPHFDIMWIGGHALLQVIDAGLGLLLTGIIVWRAKQLWPLAGALAAVLPDAPGLPDWDFPDRTWDPPWGVVVEIVVAGAALLWATLATKRSRWRLSDPGALGDGCVSH